MIYTYVAVAIFAGFGLLVALLFLLSAKLLSPSEPKNPVKNAPYESAEQTIGSNRDLDNEYLPFFMLFLPFEVLAVVLLIWSTVSRETTFNVSWGVMSLAAIAGIVAIAGYKIASGKNA